MEHFNISTRPHKTVQKRYILVDSRDRDNNLFGNTPFDYTIYFQEPREGVASLGIAPFRNVTQVQLRALAFPKVPGEHYVILDIEQFRDNLDASNASAHNASCVVFFDKVNDGEIKTVYPQGGEAYTWVMRQPIDLHKIDVHLKWNGDAGYNSTTSKFTNANGDTGISFTHHSFLLEITHEE